MQKENIRDQQSAHRNVTIISTRIKVYSPQVDLHGELIYKSRRASTDRVWETHNFKRCLDQADLCIENVQLMQANHIHVLLDSQRFSFQH